MTPRELEELLEILNSRGMSDQVAPGLMHLFDAQNSQHIDTPTPTVARTSTPAPPRILAPVRSPTPALAPTLATQLAAMLTATQVLNEHVSSFIDQAKSTMPKLAQQPVTLFAGRQFEVSAGPMSYSVTPGVRVSFNRRNRILGAGAYLNVTQSLNKQSVVNVGDTITVGIGTGDPRGFYGKSNAVLGASGPRSGIYTPQSVYAVAAGIARFTTFEAACTISLVTTSPLNGNRGSHSIEPGAVCMSHALLVCDSLFSRLKVID